MATRKVRNYVCGVRDHYIRLLALFILRVGDGIWLPIVVDDEMAEKMVGGIDRQDAE